MFKAQKAITCKLKKIIENFVKMFVSSLNTLPIFSENALCRSCLLQETELHNLSLLSLSLCCWGRTEESAMTNQSAWRVCITSKSHTLISRLLYQLNVHSVKSQSVKTTPCVVKQLDTVSLFNNAQQRLTVHLNKWGVKGPLIEALVRTVTLSSSQSNNLCCKMNPKCSSVAQILGTGNRITIACLFVTPYVCFVFNF